jgi:hypothetical protein
MPHRDAYVFSQDGTLRRDTAASPRSPFASALKSLSEPKAKQPATAPKVTPPARSA